MKPHSLKGETQMTTDTQDNNVFSQILEQLISEGSDGFKPIIEWFWNMALTIERAQALQAQPFQRTSQRTGYANGFKNKTIHSRIGDLNLKVPQVRGDVQYYPQSLTKGCRSERALNLAIAEMYVQGVSTRRVKEITEQLCGHGVSSTQVSNLTKELDHNLEEFRNRPLSETPFVILDARYEKVRHAGHVRDCAVLVAIGVTKEGRREVLGVSVALSEAEVHWRSFLDSLIKRGLKGIRLIISDDHVGLKNARLASFSSVPWQRCQFHMSQNAQSYAPKKSMREDIANSMRDIFHSRNLDEARARVKEIQANFEKSAPDFVQWLEENIEEGLVVMQFPKPIQKRLRTSNMLEALNKSIKRRTRVAGIFPNTDSCLRLVTAILEEQHEDWAASSRIYINMDGVF
jgi:putative transposase